MRWRLAVLAALLLGLIWSVGIEPGWVAQRTLQPNVASWQGPEGLKVAVASDWHFTRRAFWRGMTAERARRIVAEINAAQPDMVLLPGDFIASQNDNPDTAKPEDEIAAVLGELRAPLGAYAVMGNHDWWHDGPAIAAALRKKGITVLENDAVPLKGTPLWVVGVGDDYTGHSQPKKAVARLPAGTQALVLMHDPASLLEMPAIAGLVVAGHTHGGHARMGLVHSQ
ncbi:MAG: metallophosphoesterase [Ramlibacter sp.]|nr:metallophosphoesterase [Ramlibacter sp.]